MRLDLCCLRPTAALAARLVRVATELGIQLGEAPPPPAAFVSPTRPTVMAVAGGRVLASAVGDLPLWEVRALLVSALRALS
jgi:hypothetical protein